MSDPTDTDALIEASADQIPTSLDRVAGRITADDVFGPVIESGEQKVLTAAAVERAGGFGFGGGTASGRPVAVIEVGPAGVKVSPVLDFTRLGIAVVAALFALWKSRRSLP